MGQAADQARDPRGPGKTTAELFADRYFEQFQQVRNGGLFGPGAVPEPEPPEPEAE